MKKIIQRLLLYSHALNGKIVPALVILVAVQACSKNEQIRFVEKPVQVSKEFQFNVTPSNLFNDENSKNISLKLRLSISRFSPAANGTKLLWDTLITKQSLYDFTHNASENIRTTLTGPADTFQNLLFTYVIIYNDHGALVSRKESSDLKGGEMARLEIKL